MSKELGKQRKPCHIFILPHMVEHFDVEACVQKNSGFDAEWRDNGLNNENL